MKKLLATDYVIYDKDNDKPIQFRDGDIVIFGDKKEAEHDCIGNEIVMRCTNLPQHWQDKLLVQINK